MNRVTAIFSAGNYLTADSSGRAAKARGLLLIADLSFALALGYNVAHQYYLHNGVRSHSLLAESSGLMVWGALILVSVVVAVVVRRAEFLLFESLHQSSGSGTTILEFACCAACAGTVFLAAWLFAGSIENLASLCFLIWAALFFAWMLFTHLLLLASQRHRAVHASPKQTIAIIGAGDYLKRIVGLLAEDACVATLIDHSAISGHALAEGLANVIALARDGVIGLVVLATDDSDLPQTLVSIIECLKAAPVRVTLCDSRTRAFIGTPSFLCVAGIPMSLIADRPLTRKDMLVKMLVDKLGALLLLVLALPLLLAISLAILLETGGPIIFQQRRTGWCGRLFTVLKFRTMRHTPGPHVLYQTQRTDPRCTRVGLLLRRTSLDELPQLWNVLRGDMSLVGPRPHADIMHARERASCGPAADYVQRQRVKPGLTGWAQVHGLRGAIDTPEKLSQRVEFDRYYIENWSIWLDLKILAKTPWAVLSGENAF